MRALRTAARWLWILAALVYALPSAGRAVTMAWTPIANPGNACEVQAASGSVPGGCFGGVAYRYSIGTYEVTNAQYAEFLNEKAKSDPLFLYSELMGTSFGGINRSGSDGSFVYTVTPGRENMPVNHVRSWNALRFANWMNNGQGNGDTESGSYTGPTDAIETVTRNPGATIFLASEDEWYKAAYYNPATSSYFDYPTSSDTATGCSTPTATSNRANCLSAVFDVTVRGSYTGSASPYGTFDQAGNVWEWNESWIDNGSSRGARGGGYFSSPNMFSSSSRSFFNPSLTNSDVGFRLVLIPEPATGLLVLAGMIGIHRWLRRSA